EQTALSGLRAEVLDLIFNESLLRTFRSNLQRMDRENSLEFMLDDLEEIAAGRSGSASRAEEAVVT
ncbi:MAG TPA: hypothetical protein VEA63_11355, partial [Opitutus sp.]|nr:hypothetical protein [Opitutus sp.]